MKHSRWTIGLILNIALMSLLVLTSAPTNAMLLAGWRAEQVGKSLSQVVYDLPTDQIIVKYKVSEGRQLNSFAVQQHIQTLNAAVGVTLTYVRAMSGAAYVLRLPERMPVAQAAAVAKRIAALPEVEYAEPDRIMLPAMTPDDPSYLLQWHYFDTYGINLPTAWALTTGSPDVKVAVLDTGITGHPDLDGRWVGGYDFVSSVVRANDGDGWDSDPHDPGNWVTSAESASGPLAGCPVTNSTWHGTHIAGTIGAASNNNLGVVGVNWASPFVPVRVLGKCGGYVSDIADGLRWAVGLNVAGTPTNAHPAKVLNMSLGGPGVCATTYQNAIDDANAIGTLIVVAVGNGARNLNTTSHQPANCDGVIAVAATDRDGDRAIYSDYGALVKISAPGGETFTNPPPQNGVLSTLNTGLTSPAEASYSYMQGVSMAAPHVAGALSLMMAISPTLNLTQSVQILQDTASPFPAGSRCTTSTCGAGIVNAGAALAILAPSGTPTSTPTATATATNDTQPPATDTPTPGSPTATDTPAPTATATAMPTATATNDTQPPATDTPTPGSPTATDTPAPPATDTPTPGPTVIATEAPGTPDFGYFLYLPLISMGADPSDHTKQGSYGTE